MSFVLGDQLGEGTYGIVYECDFIDSNSKKSNDKKAIKCIPMKGKYRCLIEASIMATYKHPYLSYAEDVIVEGDELNIVQKLAKCDLAALTRNNPLPLAKVRKYIYCITKALSFLHSRNIIHGDVKANNILLYENDVVKLTDYSLSLVDSRGNYKHRVGTCSHKAPECLNGQTWNHLIDSWALGCTIYELVYGRNLIPRQKKSSKYTTDEIYHQAIVDWSSECEDDCVPFIPIKHPKIYYKKEYEVVNDLIDKLLRYEAKERLTMDEVLEHKFFAQVHVKNLRIVIKKREKREITPKVVSTMDSLNPRHDIRNLAFKIISYCLDMNYDLHELCGACIVLSYLLKKEEIPAKYSRYDPIEVLERLDFAFHELIH